MVEETVKSYESILKEIEDNVVYSIAQSIGGKVIKNENGKTERTPSFAPFLKHQNAEDMQRAYNASTGASYSGLNSLLLDSKKAEFGYKTNQWVNAMQAQMLGATKEEIEQAKANWQDKSVKIHYIQTKERIPAYELNENGEKIPLLDKDGNQRYAKNQKDANGNPMPLYKYKLENNKQVFETIDIEPVLKQERLYHIDNFPSIKKERIKELNPQIERNHIYRHMKDGKRTKGLILEDIAQRLNPVTREQIETYFKAQNMKQAYNVPKGLNEKQKEQVMDLLNQKEQSNAKKQEQVQQPKTQAQQPKKKSQSRGR